MGSRLIRAVIIIYAARILGAAEYGLFSYVLGFAGFFTIFADIGVNSLMTRDIARDPENRNIYFSNSFWIKILLLTFTALLVIFVAPYFTNIEAAKALIPLVALLVVADGIREFIIAYYRGIERMEAEALIVTLMNVTILVSGLVILYYNQTAKALLYTYIASVVVTAGLGVTLLIKRFAHIFKYISKERLLYVIKLSWPIAFSAVLGIFMLNTDIVMLGWWRSAEEIGYYAAGQRIIQVLYTLPALLASAMFPLLSRLAKEKGERERSLVERSLALIYSVAFPLAIGGIVLAQDIIQFVFGAEYLPAVPAFQILLLTPLILFPGMIILNLIIAHNKQREIIWFSASGSLGNVLFNAMLIPPLGIIGSALATVIAQLLNYGLTWKFIKKTVPFSTFKNLHRIIFASALMGIVSFVIRLVGVHVLINILVSAGFYFGLLFLLKERTIFEIKKVFY